MSSIYKKGRDGYYYYQTYQYDEATGKKNKKVFHALRTKDYDEALAKKIEFDKRYESIYHEKHSIIHSLTGRFKLFVYSFVALILCIQIYSALFLNESVKHATTNFDISQNRGQNENIKKDSVALEKKKSQSLKNFEQELTILEKQVSKIETVIPPKNVADENKIPLHNIIRIEKLNSNFSQIKYFLITPENSHKDGLLKLCDSLANANEQFTNIIISIYTDSPVGKSVALGNHEKISLQEQKNAWLALYTYNPSEGVYFDDKPGAYLGAY